MNLLPGLSLSIDTTVAATPSLSDGKMATTTSFSGLFSDVQQLKTNSEVPPSPSTKVGPELPSSTDGELDGKNLPLLGKQLPFAEKQLATIRDLAAPNELIAHRESASLTAADAVTNLLDDEVVQRLIKRIEHAVANVQQTMTPALTSQATTSAQPPPEIEGVIKELQQYFGLNSDDRLAPLTDVVVEMVEQVDSQIPAQVTQSTPINEAASSPTRPQALADKVLAALTGQQVTLTPSEIIQLRDLVAQRLVAHSQFQPQPQSQAHSSGAQVLASGDTAPLTMLSESQSGRQPFAAAAATNFLETGRLDSASFSARYLQQAVQSQESAIASSTQADLRDTPNKSLLTMNSSAAQVLGSMVSGARMPGGEGTLRHLTSVGLYGREGLQVDQPVMRVQSVSSPALAQASELIESVPKAALETPRFSQQAVLPEMSPFSPSLVAGKAASTVSTTPSSLSAQLQGVDASNLHEQVMRVISDRRVGQNRMTVQLSPASLGNLEISFRKDTDGEVNITVVARETATREFLEQFVPRVRQLLHESGVSLGQLDVRDEHTQQQAQTEGRQNNDSDASSALEESDDEILNSDFIDPNQGFHIAV